VVVISSPRISNVGGMDLRQTHGLTLTPTLLPGPYYRILERLSRSFFAIGENVLEINLEAESDHLAG
jgi:hypothetical protein